MNMDFKTLNQLSKKTKSPAFFIKNQLLNMNGGDSQAALLEHSTIDGSQNYANNDYSQMRTISNVKPVLRTKPSTMLHSPVRQNNIVDKNALRVRDHEIIYTSSTTRSEKYLQLS